MGSSPRPVEQRNLFRGRVAVRPLVSGAQAGETQTSVRESISNPDGVCWASSIGRKGHLSLGSQACADFAPPDPAPHDTPHQPPFRFREERRRPGRGDRGRSEDHPTQARVMAGQGASVAEWRRWTSVGGAREAKQLISQGGIHALHDERETAGGARVADRLAGCCRCMHSTKENKTASTARARKAQTLTPTQTQRHRRRHRHTQTQTCRSLCRRDKIPPYTPRLDCAVRQLPRSLPLPERRPARRHTTSKGRLCLCKKGQAAGRQAGGKAANL